MSAPPLIQESPTSVWNTAATPKAAASALSIQAGDILVGCAVADFSGDVLSISNSGAALIWTPKVDAGTTGSFCRIRMWSAVGDSTRSLTVSFADASGGTFGGDVYQFRSSDGIGNAWSTNAAAGAPTLNVLPTQINSAFVVCCADFTAITGARTWRTGAGAFTEKVYQPVTNYTAFVGYHPDVGAIATYAVGLTAPAPQDYTLGAVEVRGTTVVVPPGVARAGSFDPTLVKEAWF